MKAVVVSHGGIDNLNNASNVMKTADVIICADGGGEYAYKCGVIPDVLVGDLDSIDEKVLQALIDSKCKIIRYPKQKDFTDTELALNYAMEMHADEIIMLGSIGSRLDHTLSNILLLFKLSKQGIKSCVMDEKNTVYLTESNIQLKGIKGDLVSLIPIGGDVTGINTKGLLYSLYDAEIKMGDSLGISNVFVDDEAEITIKSGSLLVIKSRD